MANKVQPGDKLSTSPMNDASFVNHVIDIVNHWQRGVLLNNPRTSNTHGDDNNIIKVKNLTEAPLAMGEAFKIGDYLLGAKYPKQRWFEAEAIDTTFDTRIAIAAEPIPENKIGKAYIAGMCPIKYTGTAPSPGDYLGPKPGAATLEKGYPAFVRVEDVTDSGTPKLLLGTLGEISALLCKATAGLSAGAVSTNFQIWKGTIASGANSGFTTLPSIELQSDKESGDFFVSHWVNGGWVSPAGGGGGGDEIFEGTCAANATTGSLTPSVTVDGSTRTINNPLRIPMATGNKVMVGKKGSTYYVLGVQHGTCTVVTSDQVDGSARKFQNKTRTLYLPSPGSESGWTDWHAGQECPEIE